MPIFYPHHAIVKLLKNDAVILFHLNFQLIDDNYHNEQAKFSLAQRLHVTHTLDRSNVYNHGIYRFPKHIEILDTLL